MNTDSYWLEASTKHFEPGPKECRVDVAIIGAGITGTTAAYLLKKLGYTVAVVERGACGGFDTANTTAHLTYVTDMRWHRLVTTLGQSNAQEAWAAGAAAIDKIESIVNEERIDCDFHRVSAYLHGPPKKADEKEVETLKAEAQAISESGFNAIFRQKVPCFNTAGIEFPNQAKFHPLKYISKLLQKIDGHGSYIFDHCAVSEIKDEPLTVVAGAVSIRCSFLVLATHNPLMGIAGTIKSALFQTKLFLYSSYVVGARILRDSIPEASYWDTEEPYHYLRVEKGTAHDYAIFGGEDHKTGQIRQTTKCFDRLEKTLKKLAPNAVVDHRWSGQVIETPDGLPFIGETAANQFVATGFGGNGMTFGTIGAMMAVDRFLKKENPWAKLFDVNRKHAMVGTGRYLRENKDYPSYLIKNWLHHAEKTALSGLKPNEGKIIKYKGHKVAAYRNAHGKISIHSAICTHLQCIVEWNKAEKTWDCPCHGSRFAATGEVLSGPAEESLAELKMSDE